MLTNQASLSPSDSTLCDLLDDVAFRHPQHCVQFHSTDELIDYSTLAQQARRMAGGLAASGVSRGDVVASLLPPGRSFLISFLGTVAAAAAASPLPWPALGDIRVQCERLLRRLPAGVGWLVVPSTLRSVV